MGEEWSGVEGWFRLRGSAPREALRQTDRAVGTLPSRLRILDGGAVAPTRGAGRQARLIVGSAGGTPSLQDALRLPATLLNGTRNVIWETRRMENTVGMGVPVRRGAKLSSVLAEELNGIARPLSEGLSSQLDSNRDGPVPAVYLHVPR